MACAICNSNHLIDGHSKHRKTGKGWSIEHVFSATAWLRVIKTLAYEGSCCLRRFYAECASPYKHTAVYSTINRKSCKSYAQEAEPAVRSDWGPQPAAHNVARFQAENDALNPLSVCNTTTSRSSPSHELSGESFTLNFEPIWVAEGAWIATRALIRYAPKGTRFEATKRIVALLKVQYFLLSRYLCLTLFFSIFLWRFNSENALDTENGLCVRTRQPTIMWSSSNLKEHYAFCCKMQLSSRSVEFKCFPCYSHAS